MHSQGIVHRDIKPENLMLSGDNEVKVIDFGLSKRAEGKAKAAGTPHYIAPEVLDGNYTTKVDIWALGVILYVMMCGYLPFDNDNDQKLFKLIREGTLNFNHE
jgi:serine/threonine protein kinase